MSGLNLVQFHSTYEEEEVEEDDDDIWSILTSEGVHFLLSSDSETKVPVPLSSISCACAGKLICLLFSANWCRPCRNFTPHLVQLYDALKANTKRVEIILVSCDHDETGFKEHFKTMPWFAVPFDTNLCRRLSQRYRVNQIPSLVPLTSDAVPAEQDLIRFIQDYGVEAFPFTRKRMEELRAIDNALSQGGNLELLLAHQKRDFLVHCQNGIKVQVSNLIGKTIGLYFGANWCPPCHAFVKQLSETYAEIGSCWGEQSFEVVFVSTDRNLEEFTAIIKTMPWFVIPYEDKSHKNLCRIFDIKKIPSLVIIGPDGKTITRNGRNMVSLYGADAFPFTESRITEIEAGLKREGNALPPLVMDMKHNHSLRLEMAKAYVCNFCQRPGRFWTLSCGVCNYDLHPSCLQQAS